MTTHRDHVLLAAMVVVVGCSGAGERPPTGGPQTAEDVLAAAWSRPLPKTLSGRARMEAYVDGKARKADLLVQIERPGRVHLQALTPTLEMVAVLATDGERFTSFERGGRECATGRACPRNMARLLPLALPPAQLAEALLGRPPLIVAPGAAGERALRWDGERRAWRVELRAPPLRQELWVRPPRMDVLASRLWRGDGLLLSVAWADHDRFGAQGPPARMRVRTAADKVDLSVELREVERDAPIEAEAFAVPCPSGMAVRELPCAADGAGEGLPEGAP
jgi:hypothetical protein